VVVRLATWNLGHQFGDHGRRQRAIVSTLHALDPDVLCLQEVWAEEGGQDQVDILGTTLGLHAVRTPSIFWRGQSFGNAVLSRWPILESETVALTDAKGERTPRTLLFAVIDSPHGVLTCVSTHFEHRFDRSATRVAQSAQLCAEIVRRRSDPDVAFPIVVGGDLNAVPDSDEMRMLTGRSTPPEKGLVLTDAWEIAGDGSPGFTWAGSNPHLADATWPNRRLDYILVSWPRPKGVGVPISAQVFGADAIEGVVPSDHYGVVAELRTS
jgi:endonuclease/exonuclease/phosphatase family metal-dependent hydrolase